MRISSDSNIFWHHGFFKLNLTMVTTWALILVMVAGSRMVTSKLTTGVKIPRWQNLLEIIVVSIRQQLSDTGLKKPAKYLPFIGTLFLFIAFSNLCTILPGYTAPTGSLSTTAALAIAVFVAVPIYGISERGLIGYLKEFLHPNILMLPLNIISELSRTLALAVRLFGNIMSGAMIVAILLMIAPLFFPDLIIALGLLTGMVQAYIFGILATVYIAAATQADGE